MKNFVELTVLPPFLESYVIEIEDLLYLYDAITGKYNSYCYVHVGTLDHSWDKLSIKAINMEDNIDHWTNGTGMINCFWVRQVWREK